MLQNGFVVIFQLLNPEALKKPRNKRILYITFLFHNIKTNHTRIIVAVIRFIFLLFRFTNKNSMIENTTIIEHTIASQLLLYAVDALFLLSSCFNYCKIVFSCGSNERCFESGLSSGFSNLALIQFHQ